MVVTACEDETGRVEERYISISTLLDVHDGAIEVERDSGVGSPCGEGRMGDTKVKVKSDQRGSGTPRRRQPLCDTFHSSCQPSQQGPGHR